MMSDEHRKKMDNRKSEIKHIQDLLLKGGCCIKCGFNKDPRILELHHIAGRKNSDIVIPVCPNCHRTLSMDQEPNKIQRNNDNKSEQERIGWNLEGLSNLFRMLSFEMKEQSELLIGED